MENAKVVTLTVTEAEQALIEANRKKEAAMEVERLAQKKVLDAKKVARKQEQITSFKQSAAVLDTVYNQFYTDLVYEAGNGIYTHTVKPTTRAFDASNYLGDGKSEVLAVENVPFNEHIISLTANSDIYVRASYENGAYRFSIHGIGYEFSERHYKKARTVHEKINEYHQRKIRLAEGLTKKKSLAEQLLQKLKVENPEAEVVANTVSQPHYDYRRNGRPIQTFADVATVMVQYPNGLKVNYRPAEENGELKANFYSCDATALDSTDIVNALKILPKKA
jgi:hypothetical protein